MNKPLLLLAAGLMLAGCGMKTDYTRGIGVYPGNPKEDFSPTMQTDAKTYRNIALGRAVYQSSSFDYNLTAHLLTDGIIAEAYPKFLKISTPKGLLPKREREWTIDGNEYSANMLEGGDTFLEFDFGGRLVRADEFRLTGMSAQQKGQNAGASEITLQGSADGVKWVNLGSKKGSRPFGIPIPAGYYYPTPVFRFNESIKLSDTGDYSFYRLILKQKGTSGWNISNLELLKGGVPIDLKPSCRFSSTWMSAGSGEEWVYVDFGAVSSFDKVVLHWIEKGKGKIQVSDDAQDWTDIATLPEAEGNITEVLCNGNARYMRLLLQSPENKGANYVLTELEVMGRGGLTAVPARQPAPTSDELILSGGNWKVQRASLVAAPGFEIASSRFDDGNWLTATVPGSVLTSYVKTASVPDPNFGDGILQISESFFRDNFWYRDVFELPKGWNGYRLLLNFDGINWKANIFLNGEQVGHIDGGFMRGEFDVTEVAKEGSNYLAVEIIMNDNFGSVKEKCKKNTDYNGGILGADNPTFHASIGWDWICTIRGRNSGIWNDVRLTAVGDITLKDPLVQTVLNLPDTTIALISSEVVVKNHSGVPVEGVLEGSIGDITFEKKVSMEANEEKEVVFNSEEYPQLRVDNPQLWWPRGYGKPHLYDAKFRFIPAEKSAPSYTLPFKAGLRQMTFSEDGGVLVININGRRFIGRGGNWGFSEHNLNYRGREYDAAVAYHADMNFTMIRNWVGQTGDDEFFDACDRHGIMVWQDFWLANPADGPDPKDDKMFMDNAEDFLKRIRRHPSIGLYCGRNEGYPPEQIDKALRKLIKEEHSDIHFISSSADDVVSGHGPYNMFPPRVYFELENGRDKFHSERGMPSVMNFQSLQRTIPKDSLWPQSVAWSQHDFTMEGAQRCSTFNEMMHNAFGEIDGAEQFCNLAQWLNYDGYRAMFESRSYARKGLLLWMSHSAWPSMVWQTYDYYFDPLGSYFGCKKANEPLHIQWNPTTDKVEVVNYSAGHHPSLKAQVQIVNLDGKVVWEQTSNVDSHEDTTIECIDIDFPASVSEVHFIKLRLTEGEDLISDNFYVRGVEEGNYQALNSLGKITLTSAVKFRMTPDGKWSGTATLTNPTSVPALMIRLTVTGIGDNDQILPMFYSDNYFSLLPGEKKTVTMKWKNEDSRGEMPKLSITGFNLN